MQAHFICPDCGFFSKLSGTCQNESCISNGERLKECHCDNNRHTSVLKKSSEEGEVEEEMSDEEKEIRRNDSSNNILDLDSPESS